MLADGSQAIIPKARGMYAKRINHATYEELMRRRTVPEVAARLKKHPYFQNSLASLNTQDPHRAQLEELLSMDVFNKYEQLARYDYTDNSFSGYFLVECEVHELLRAIHLLSIGHTNAYLSSIPHYLEGKLKLDLFLVGKANSFKELVDNLRFTPYGKPLRRAYEQDPNLRNFPLAEAALLRYFYEYTFALARKNFSGRELEAVQSLFKREAEVYNISVIMRIKTYFAKAYTPEDIAKLLMPYTFRVPKRVLKSLMQAGSPEEVVNTLNIAQKRKLSGPITPEELDAEAGRALNDYASHLLHLTTSPAAALAAFMTLAKQERENAVNVIEGVRYGLAPEKIRVLLKYN